MAFSGYAKNEPDYHEDLLLDVVDGVVGTFFSADLDTLELPLMPQLAGMKFFLDISVESGTAPTLDVTIQTKIGGLYFDLGSFDTKSVPERVQLYITGVPRVLRVKYVIGGNDTLASFTVVGVRC